MKELFMADNRRYYFDWLRVLVVLLIIPHHVALTYSHIGKGYVYTEEPVNSLYYFIQSDFLNLWFMMLLFFISGVSAFYSLSKRDSKGFVIERFKKLLIPVFFYVLILGPLTAYFSQMKIYHWEKSFVEFYIVYLNNIQDYLGWAQMWYCAYLFTFSIIALPLLKYFIKRKELVDNINNFLMKKYNLFIPMYFLIIVEVLLRPVYPGYQNLISDWANFIVYLTFFVVGFLLGQSINIFNKIRYLFKFFIILSIVSTILYITIDYFGFGIYGLHKYFLALLKGVAEYSWVMVLITISKRFLNFNNKLLSKLSKSSFGLYIFHYTILTISNIYLLPLNMNHYFKFLISIIVTYLVYYILYKFLIIKIKPLRLLCGISILTIS